MEDRSHVNQGSEDCYECDIVDLNLQIDCPNAPNRPPGLHRHQSGNRRWIYLSTEVIERESSIEEAITGKYLFFSADQAALLTIAQCELTQHGFHVAKVPARNPPKMDYVLCLYYSDDSRRGELATRVKTDYSTFPVKYRYWKSDDDTRAGRYSEQFLSRLSDASSHEKRQRRE